MTNNTIFTAAKAKVQNLEGLKDGNKEFRSVSTVIKVCTSKTCLGAGYLKAFQALGVTEPKGMTPKAFFDLLPACMKRTEKKDGKEFTVALIWALRTKTEGKGKERKAVLNDKGLTVKEEYRKAVQSWSPRVLFTLLAQAQEEKAKGAK